ncbi:tail protein [Escherichia phage ZCEC13]|nr:tail protein [Escherichia phage ZCEC13]
MTIIKRADLGRPLTWDELDDNFQQVDNLTAAASAAVSSAAASATAAATSATASATSATDAANSAANAAAAIVSAVKSTITFTTGGTLNSNLDRISDGTYLYYWTGAYPVTVAAASTVESTGGIAPGFWAVDNDQLMRNLLTTVGDGTGADYIPLPGGGTVQDALWYKTVEMFGAVGDGVTDDSSALQSALNWVCGASYRKLVFSSGKKYRHSVGLTATFGASSTIFCHIDMCGALYPDATVGDALTISEATYCFFDLNIVGDGYDVSTMPDYSLPDPDGAQQGIVVNSCRGCRVHVNGNGYAGRVLRTKGTGTVKLSFLTIQIITGEGSCGQAAYLEATSDAFGRISHAQTQWDYYGSVLKSLTDVTISYWEYGNKNSAVPALLIDNCGSLDGSNITGGSTWDADTSTTLKIVNGQGIHFTRVQVGEAYNGLVIEGEGTVDDKPTVVIDYLLSYKTNTAVTLNNTTGVQIKSGLMDNTYDGVVYRGNIHNCSVNIDGRNNFTRMHFAGTGVNIDSLRIGGGLYTTTTAPFISMVNATVNQLSVVDTVVNTAGLYLNIPTSNQCVVRGGMWSGSASATPIPARPKHISGVVGVKTVYLSAAASFPIGTVQGDTLTLTHGLWATPYQLNVTPFNVSLGTTFANGNIVVKTLSSTQVVLMYTGATTLTESIPLIVEMRSESRLD